MKKNKASVKVGNPNPRAVNPRYRGMKLSDAVRVLTRPKNPDARKALGRIQGRARTAPLTRSKP